MAVEPRSIRKRRIAPMIDEDHQVFLAEWQGKGSRDGLDQEQASATFVVPFRGDSIPK